MFERKKISIITGTPGSGKTTYSIKLANELQEYYHKEVLYVALESNINEMTKLSYEVKISFKVISPIDQNLRSVITNVKNEDLQNQLCHNKGIDVVFIDYIQLINNDEKDRDTQMIKTIEWFKDLASQLDLHIVLISQCQRNAGNNKIILPNYIEDKLDEYEIHIMNNIKKGILGE